MAEDREPPQTKPGDEPTATATAEALDELTLLRREVDELRDKNLRLLAEQRNMQARAQREREESLRYAEGALARELLVVIDGLERTLESAKTAPDAASVVEGVRIVYEHFLKTLKARGIEPIAALHQPFDPGRHEALLQQPSDEHEPGTVTQEIERGYRMHDRVLRPARVAVARKNE